MVTLIHPSRSRVNKAVVAARYWLGNAGEAVQYILSVDSDDPQLSWYTAELNAIKSIWPTSYLLISENRSAIDAINNAAKEAEGNVIVVMSDDFDCPSQWATSLLRCVEGRTDWIAKTNDGIQRWIITLPIMDRAYYDRFGYIYHPDYMHMFCDTHMTAVADLIGRKINLELRFPHNHYSVGKSDRDEINIRADKTWGQGEYTFMKHYRNNFGLVDPPGRITDQNFLNWVNQKR